MKTSILYIAATALSFGAAFTGYILIGLLSLAIYLIAVGISLRELLKDSSSQNSLL